MSPANFAFGAVATALCIAAAQAAPAQADGSMLPFDVVPSASVAKPRLQDSVHKRRAQPEHLKPGAPNVLIVLLDDVGFGQASTFGGEIDTPTLSKLAKEGISYNTFHTTAICSPRVRRCSPGATTSAWATAPLRSARSTGTAIPA
jgi:arylsulfatase